MEIQMFISYFSFFHFVEPKLGVKSKLRLKNGDPWKIDAQSDFEFYTTVRKGIVKC